MYRSIVVGTDGSATATAAVNEAARLAKGCDAAVHLVSAYKAAGVAMAASGAWVAGTGEWDAATQQSLEERLEREAQALRDEGLKVETYVVPCDPAAAIIQVAESTESDLVVVGSKGMKGARRVLGSVPNTVAHNAPCSVMVVKTC